MEISEPYEKYLISLAHHTGEQEMLDLSPLFLKFV